MLRRVCLVLPLYLFTFSPLPAQTFTQRIQQKGNSGEGKLTVVHDKAIDDLVNGSGKLTNTDETQKGQNQDKDKDTASATAKTPATPQEPQRDSIDVQQIDSRYKVMRGGVKVNGYRVQAFAGGNQRKDRQKAEQVGNTIKANFPEEPVYVHFYSPRWICRVGNYRTYEEAHEMLTNIRKLGISGASIVKGKITVASY